MGRIVEGLAVLLMLSVFFAYLTAPGVAAIGPRLRIGRRPRPIANPAALALLYGGLVMAIVVVWRLSAEGITHWVHVTAPASVDRLFTTARAEPIDRLIAIAPLSEATESALKRRIGSAIDYLEREI